PAVSLDELLSGQPSAPRHRTHLGDLHTVACDVVDLPRFHRVHDGSGVVPELTLADHLHGPGVAPCSARSYTRSARAGRRGAEGVFEGAALVDDRLRAQDAAQAVGGPGRVDVPGAHPAVGVVAE